MSLIKSKLRQLRSLSRKQFFSFMALDILYNWQIKKVDVLLLEWPNDKYRISLVLIFLRLLIPFGLRLSDL